MQLATADDLRRLTEEYLDAWRRRDVTAIAGAHTPDGVIDSPMYATLKGRQAIAEAQRAFFTSFPDATMTIEAILIDAPHVATFVTISATHVNEFYGLPGTNRRVVIRLARLLTMDGPLITHERRVYDFTGLLVQVGVLKAKPSRPLDE